MEKIFLVCRYDGEVSGYIVAETFDEAYDNTIMDNNGEFLVELNDENIKKINDLYKKIKGDK